MSQFALRVLLVVSLLTGKLIIICAKGYVFIRVSKLVSLYFCLLEELRNIYSTDFHRIRWKGGAEKKFFFILVVIRISYVSVELGLR